MKGIPNRRSIAPLPSASAHREALSRFLGVWMERGESRDDSLRGTPEWEDLEKAVRDLAGFPLESLGSHDERTAFWLNIYNSRVLLDSAASDAPCEIGGHRFGTDDIEHGILRANRPKHRFSFRPFRKSDARRRYSLDDCDPRIHFALLRNAAPPSSVVVYDATDLNAQLNHITRTSLDASSVLDMAANRLTVPRSFRRYARDFGRSRVDIVRFVLLHSDTEAQAYLRQNLLTTRLIFRE